MENEPVLHFNHREIFIPLRMLFFDAARSEINFQMLEIKHEAEASAFHLETHVVILSNTSLLTQLLCCAETNKTLTMKRQWTNSYILHVIIFDNAGVVNTDACAQFSYARFTRFLGCLFLVCTVRMHIWYAYAKFPYL